MMQIRIRLIATNVLVSLAILGTACLAVTQGIYKFSLESARKQLFSLGAEANRMVREDILSFEDMRDPEAALSSVASYFADQVYLASRLHAIVYGRSGNFLASDGSVDASEGSYAGLAMESVEKNAQGIAFSSVNGANHYVLFAPLRDEQNMPFGVVAVFYPIRSTEQTVNLVLMSFAATALVIAFVAAFFCNFVYEGIFRPIRQLSYYLRQMPEQSRAEPPSIAYKGNDEIRSLIDSVSLVACQINSAADEAKAERANVASVISAIQDAVVAINLSGDPMITNEKFSEFFPSDTDYFAVVGRIDEVVKRVEQTNTVVNAEFEYDGRCFLVTAVPVPSQEESAIADIKYVTTIKKMEQSQQKFVSSVSHELRTPLTTINGYIDLLERRGTGDPEVTKKALATTKSEIARLLRMVNELLSLNTYQSAEFDLIFTNIDPDDLIAEAVSQMNIKAEENGIYVLYSRIPLPEIRGDRDRIKQVLI
ncbi:MAG: hypothetical protein LBC69_01090, partial [Eubacteriaceae bacterium]|nr:hypothetical protein [Eubacteriaceae bacterium]